MLIQKMLMRFHRWLEVSRTIRVLNRLDNDELNDLGIGRWRIPDIAESGHFKA